MVSYVDQRLKVIQAASADPEVAQKGQAFAKEKALQKLMSSIPCQLHVAYAFAKQDAYKLAKAGLHFNPAAGLASPVESARLEGNKTPEQVQGYASEETRLRRPWPRQSLPQSREVARLSRLRPRTPRVLGGEALEESAVIERDLHHPLGRWVVLWSWN